MLSKSQEASVGHYHNNFGRSKMISFFLPVQKSPIFLFLFLLHPITLKKESKSLSLCNFFS